MGLTPTNLDELLVTGLEASRWDWRHPFRRRYVMLPARGVRIRLQLWHSVSGEPGHWRYTRRQAREMHKALLPILARYEKPLYDLITLLHDR